MAKIKITENELRQIIRESVVSVLNEGIKEDRAARHKRRYEGYQKALNNYNTKYTKEWGELTPDERKPWEERYADIVNSGRATPGLSPESIYNSDKASAKANLTAWSNKKGVANLMQGDLDTANQSLTNLYKQLNVNDHTAAMGAIQNLQTQNKAYQKAIADLTGILNGTIKEGVATREVFDGQAAQETQAVQVPGVEDVLNKVRNLRNQNARLHREIGSRGNINTALKTINTWKQNSVKLANMEKTNQQNLAAKQTPQQPTNPTTKSNTGQA